MPELEVFIQSRVPGTNPFRPSVDRRMFQYEGLEVEATLSDSRTCKFTCPIADTNALRQSNVQHLLPGRRAVFVTYRGRPVFWGPIVKPIFNFKEGKVEVNAIDPSIYWKFHQLDLREAEDDAEYKVNGRGFMDLVRAADVTAAESADGALDPGVITQEALAEDYLLPGEGAGERRTLRFRNGQNIYDAAQQIQEAADGPDWQLVPVDETHDLAGAVFPGPGYYTALRAVEQMGQDLSDQIIFHYGHGSTNLDNFIYEPDLSSARNRFVAQNGRGVYRVAKHTGSYDMGIMEGWEEVGGPSGGARPAFLSQYAKEQVKRYAEPVPTFTIEPTWDAGMIGSAPSTPWRFPTGYDLGDYIRAIAKKDRLTIDLVGRVVRVKLTQQNAAENVKSFIECVPHFEALSVTTGNEIQ